MKSILFFCLAFSQKNTSAQNLTISTSGESGASGTNWTRSGTDPLIISVTGPANIHPSVIQDQLNNGHSVVVNNSAVGTAINANITKVLSGNTSLTFKDIGLIKMAPNVEIKSTSGALNVILWADSDNSQGDAVTDYIFIDAGVSIASNGGAIVMAGGPDNGVNGGVAGDGIPDGFAWNGSNSTSYGANQLGGLTIGPRGGTGNVISLLSGGGDIILRGATSTDNGFPGITSQSRLKFVAGTGRIIIYGKSTTGHGVEFTYGGSPAIAMTSSSPITPAIDIKGTTSDAGERGFWASNNASGNILIESGASSGGGISIEGVNTNASGVGLNFGADNTNIVTQLLSQSGSITLKGNGPGNSSLLLQGDVYIGNRRDASTIEAITPGVTASAAAINIQANGQSSFSAGTGKKTYFKSTGALHIRAHDNGTPGTISWTGNTEFGTTFKSISLGESGKNYILTVNNTLTAAGDITAWCSEFTLANGVGLISTVAGNIAVYANGTFNTAGTTRRTISSLGGNISIIADADVSGNGGLDLDYLTINPNWGNTTLRGETLNWATGNQAEKPYIDGTGKVTIESSDASFGTNLQTSFFVFNQDGYQISGLTLGKSTNTANVTVDGTALTVAGGISIYGGLVYLSQNLISSATGDIFVRANTNNNGGSAIATTASILKTAGTGTLTLQSRARVNSGTITASGTGVLNVVLWSDYANDNNGGVEIGSVTTNGGHLWLGGTSSTNGSYTWKGLAVGDGPSIGALNNNHNGVDFYGPVSTNGGDVLIWGGNGNSTGQNGLGVYPGASVNAGSGNVTIIADQLFSNNLTLTTSGKLTLVPDGGSFPANFTWSGTSVSGNFDVNDTYNNLIINNYASLGGLSIGYFDGHSASGVPVVIGNSTLVTINTPISIAGPILLYSPGLTISNALASTAAGDISLFTNSLTIPGGVALTSAGKLVIEPIAAGTTIGLAGGAGTLAISASHFNSNFTDGFSEIRIGNSAAGLITLGAALTLRDNLRLATAGSFALNETVDIGDNNLRFYGLSITPAADKFVKTKGTGKLIMNIVNAAGKLFPTGITHYNPVTITNKTGVTDEFYVTASTGVYKGGSTSGVPVGWTSTVNVTWNIGNISGSTGSGNVDLRFMWDVANETGSLLAPRLMHHNGSNWTEQPGIPAVDPGARKLDYADYTGTFSPFTLAEANTLLPLSWLSLSGKRIAGDDVAIKWTTASAVNNDYFEIQRKAEGGEFTAIGRVPAMRNTSAQNTYNYTDHDASGSVLYYRVKQVDIDSKFSFSGIVAVNEAAASAYSVTATPGVKQVVIGAPRTIGKANVIILDGNGRKVAQHNLLAGRNTISTTSLIAGGVYFIKIIEGNLQRYSGSFIN